MWGKVGVCGLKLEYIILMMCSCSEEMSLFFCNICLTSQSIGFLLWTTNLTGDGWASGKIEQLCDWSLITEHFPLICQMSLPFGGSDLVGLFWQPLLGYMTLFGEIHLGYERRLCWRMLWIPFGKIQLFDLISLKWLCHLKNIAHLYIASFRFFSTLFEHFSFFTTTILYLSLFVACLSISPAVLSCVWQTPALSPLPSSNPLLLLLS